MPAVVTVKNEDFAAVATHDGNAITVMLEGTADSAAFDALEGVLSRVHTEALRQSVAEVAIDLRKLEFMNSSCFKTFVSWINEIQELDDKRRYKIRFISNPSFHWQKRSLHSLRCFAIELITVTER